MIQSLMTNLTTVSLDKHVYQSPIHLLKPYFLDFLPFLNNIYILFSWCTWGTFFLKNGDFEFRICYDYFLNKKHEQNLNIEKEFSSINSLAKLFLET